VGRSLLCGYAVTVVLQSCYRAGIRGDIATKQVHGAQHTVYAAALENANRCARVTSSLQSWHQFEWSCL
jgi:hypothetical protein